MTDPLLTQETSDVRARAINAMILAASSPIEGCETGNGGCGGTHTDCYYGALFDAAFPRVSETVAHLRNVEELFLGAVKARDRYRQALEDISAAAGQVTSEREDKSPEAFVAYADATAQEALNA
jgi:hypothetical protein